MGCSKLLLDWRGSPLLEHVLGAWQRSRVARVVVVVRPEETAVRHLCERMGVDIVCPQPAPEEMKRSVQHALRHIAAHYQPRAHDRWLLAPADLPQLTSPLIDQVIEASEGRNDVVVPRFGRRRGHPASFPWSLADQVFALAAEEGIDRIVAREAVFHVDLAPDAAPDDIDTPEDYRRLRSQ